MRLDEENSRYSIQRGERSDIKTCSTSFLGTRVGRNLDHGLYLYYTYKKHSAIPKKRSNRGNI
jgi:hypothetical protein